MPLTRLDETLRHQIATTFDHGGTSDPPFFDRYWFSSYDLSHPENVVLPSGEVRVPGHREAPAAGTVNGRPLAGHQIVICSGRVPFLGLADDVRPW